MGKGEPNLLVTFDPVDAFGARLEVLSVLEDIGEENPEFLPSEVRGLFEIRVGVDPKDCVRRLVSLCREELSKFQLTYHWTPVEKWCSSTLEEMADIVKELDTEIGEGERWRMRVEKRFYGRLETPELIEELTSYVDKPNVDLEDPDKTIWIEIIGGRAGFALLELGERLSVNDIREEVALRD